MIHHGYKTIFVHIPKCAGTTVERHLLFCEGPLHSGPGMITKERFDEELFPLSIIGKENRDKYRIGTGSNQHDRIRMYPELYRNSYYSFSFVRNPWERIVSEYFYILEIERRQPGYYLKTTGVPSVPDFDVFVNSLEKYIPKDHYPNLNQVDFLTNHFGKISVDFIGRVENFHEDFTIVCENLGIKKPENKKINKTQRLHYKEYYNSETIKVVEKKYEKDIDIFKYKF